jgi:Xaa-Pro aminopeptidase
MTVSQKIQALRNEMASRGIDAVIIPTGDPHQSEYIPAYWQEREWLSGFTGSAGWVVVTAAHAGLWTDSRYFLQAEMELSGTGIELHKMINQFGSPYVDYLAENLSSGASVGVNGFLFSMAAVEVMKTAFNPKNIRLDYRCDVITSIWADRPPLSDAQIVHHDHKYAGQTVQEKIENVRKRMTEVGVQYHLITTLDDLAWTFNIRGKDVEFNPVALGYALIAKETAHLFIDEGRLSPKLKSLLRSAGIKIEKYHSLIAFVSNLGENDGILIDQHLCSMAVYEAINAKIVHGASIPKWLKAVKNPTEQAHIRKSMKKDGAALAEAFYWLQAALHNGEMVTEYQLAEQLSISRSRQKDYQGESFSAIVGYNANGAIIHYRPDKDNSSAIKPDGILLVDSGGQYLDGTTDITRTFAMNQPMEEHRTAYTLILKGLISLSRAVFPEGTMGVQLDAFARQHLWSHGLNYGHGTGHGVGFFLNVHEPPQGFAPGISERGKTVHVEGMLSSNEPGYYKVGEFGMRLENLILVQKANVPGFLQFETVTLYPFEHALISLAMLTRDERQWLNDYHKKVYNTVAPALKGEVKQWFKEKCRKI